MSLSYFAATLGDTLYEEGSPIVINFSEGVISTGGTIKITQDVKSIEEITIGSEKTSGGVYHSNSMVWDYEYNWIALSNADIFKHLANHSNQKISDKIEEEWAQELRKDWKIAINGELYGLEKREQSPDADQSYSYHETAPEYTPGVDKSGNGDVVLTPSSGVTQLIIDPSNLEQGGSYAIDLSDAGLISVLDNSKELLPALLEINVGSDPTPTPTSTPTPTPIPTDTKKDGDEYVVEIAELAARLMSRPKKFDTQILDFLNSATRETLFSSRSKDSAARITGLNAFHNAGIPMALIDTVNIKKRGINVFVNLSGSKYDDGKENPAKDDMASEKANDDDAKPAKDDAAQGQKVSVRELSLKQKQSIDISEGTKFDITEIGNGTFAIAKSKKQLKQLSRSNADIVYFKNKGKLYFNDNLISKGWGNKEQGGLLANFENNPDLSKSNFDSLIDYVKDYDKSGTKYDDSNWFLTAYRNTPQKEMFSLFDGMKEIESTYEDTESEWSGLAIGVFQDSYVNGNAWKILWTNSPDKGPGYRNGISSDQYDAFKNSFGWRGDAEMLSQGKEQYIFF